MAYKLKPGELKLKWLAYKKKCDGHVETVPYGGEMVDRTKPLIYSIESFCSFAGLCPDDLVWLEKKERYQGIIKEIRHAVLARKLDALINGEGSTPGLIFDLRANHGLYVKSASDKGDMEWDFTIDMEKLKGMKKALDSGGAENGTAGDAVAEMATSTQPEPPVPVEPYKPFKPEPYDYVKNMIII